MFPQAPDFSDLIFDSAGIGAFQGLNLQEKDEEKYILF